MPSPWRRTASAIQNPDDEQDVQDWTVDPANTKLQYLSWLNEKDPDRFNKEIYDKMDEDGQRSFDEYEESKGPPREATTPVFDHETYAQDLLQKVHQAAMSRPTTEEMSRVYGQPQEDPAINIGGAAQEPPARKYHINMQRSKNKASPTGWSWAIKQEFE